MKGRKKEITHSYIHTYHDDDDATIPPYSPISDTFLLLYDYVHSLLQQTQNMDIFAFLLNLN